MDAKRTALLLIEYQNDFVTPGGAQYGAVADEMARTGMLANTLATVEAARKAGVQVMMAPIAFEEGYPELPANAYGIFAGIKQAGAFKKGSWGAQIIDDLTPAEGDIVVEGKRGLDCFASTNLDFILRQRGVETLAIAGFLTNCCVESTMRSAYERGFEVVTLTDCTATLSEEEQRVATSKDFGFFSKPMTGADFVTALSA